MRVFSLATQGETEHRDVKRMNEMTDMDMTEVEASNASSTPQSAHAGDDVVGGLLALARQLVDRGNPSHALQAGETEHRDVKRMNEMTDMDMTEVEASNASSTPQSAHAGDDVVGGLLALARQLVDRGNPSHALQAVVMAMRTRGGEEAVFYILERARELYRSKLQASSEADQLASLFAECVISEAQPATSVPSVSPSSFSQLPAPIAPLDAVECDAYGKSILAETGRRQIVLDTFSDGSSFICLQCAGLVSNHRKDEHYAYWCQF